MVKNKIEGHAFFEIVNEELKIMPTELYKKKYSLSYEEHMTELENSEENFLYDENQVVSVTKENNELIITFWQQGQGVPFTWNELMNIFKVIKNKEKLISMMVLKNV